MPYRKLKSWGGTKPPAGTPLDSSSPLVTGLRGFWLFSEGAGAIASDSSGSANPGTITSGTTWDRGKFGGPCLNFDGVAGNVTLGTTRQNRLAPVSSDFTVLAWVNLSGGSYIYWDSTDASNQPFMSVYMTAGGFLACQCRDASANQFSFNTGLDMRNAWHQIAMVRKGSTMYLFQDGLQKASATDSTVGAFDTSGGRIPRIGAGATGADVWSAGVTGRIDHVVFWLRALLQGELQALYSQPFAAFCAPRRRIISQAAAGTAKFRKTLSGIGTGTGKRQVVGT